MSGVTTGRKTRQDYKCWSPEREGSRTCFLARKSRLPHELQNKHGLMFYSVAGPAAIFKTNRNWNCRWVAASPVPSSPHSISLCGEPANRGHRGPACCLISEMLNPLRALWDSLKRVIKAQCLSKPKSLRAVRMKSDIIKTESEGSKKEFIISSESDQGETREIQLHTVLNYWH